MMVCNSWQFLTGDDGKGEAIWTKLYTYAFPVPISAMRRSREVVGMEGWRRYPRRLHRRCWSWSLD